jgi:hypothetical protein
MNNRELVAYSLIFMIIASPFLFLWARGLVRRRALRKANEPIHIRR